MKLSDTKCKALKPAATPIKLSDGGGLYLEVMPNGNKFWRQKYRFAGKEKRLTHGAYPIVTLADAREKRDEAKKLIVAGIDPADSKKQAKEQLVTKHENNFEKVAREWMAHKKDEWTPQYARTIKTRLSASIVMKLSHTRHQTDARRGYIFISEQPKRLRGNTHGRF